MSREDLRRSITAAELESAILQSVKAVPGCDNFIEVFVRAKTSKSSSEPNWAVRGVRFGKADRKTVSETLARVVARLQQEFRLTSDNPAN
jgi:hypothetical protein